MISQTPIPENLHNQYPTFYEDIGFRDFNISMQCAILQDFAPLPSIYEQQTLELNILNIIWIEHGYALWKIKIVFKRPSRAAYKNDRKMYEK